MAGVIFVNPNSGPDETSLEVLQARFPGHRVEACEPWHLSGQIRDALLSGPDFIGVAGGDGTIRLAADLLIGQSVPLLPIPAGTRNHFARDVGVADLDAAAAAATGRVIEIDVGRVNGLHFVNNSSIGLYPKVVIRREAHQRRLRKGVANIVAAWEQIRAGERVDVEIHGVTHRVWMVFVGNGEYGEGLLDLADRETLDANVLDLRVVRGDQPLSRLRILGALLLGRLARSPLVLRERQATITVRPRRRTTVEVALDGEVEVLKTPLQYESVPHALRVLVPQ
ncbi:MAG: NAD(+)/NADH kinase [Actinomycetota bacterium]|nr:NAD(+)/NADH kinase [Actinomycetota bacterium]